ncbi:hypothetical protein [Tenacibaculum jejuense]|uniref:Co-chaperone DjlA N-terminal domain-containing protein n=1 Tax=Tenacibaculum jejuense TaxID=584609 RepID=A0A238UBJ7_9FLAO|nr:hypothetical protein [Tenacibaculum jejuense]SNR15790.1 conserved protein of unknown function [Tenacibaculum jejuense]
MKSVSFTKDFYRAISNLFYSFSMIDKTMSVQEKKEIVWAVKQEWATNEYGFDSEELIYETMRSLIKEKQNADQAFEKFKVFFIANKELFSKDVKQELLEACHKICNADHGKNKSELILLTKLHKLIKTSNLNN